MIHIIRRCRIQRRPMAASARIFITLLATLLLQACDLFTENALDRVQKSGELRVVTYLSPTTYYDTPEGPAGFEYDLASAFADYLGVKLKLVVAERQADVLPRLKQGDADMAAAGIGVTTARRESFDFTSPVQIVQQLVIYRHLSRRPESVEDLVGHPLEIHAGTSHAEKLQALKEKHPELEWTETTERSTGELLQMVWQGLLDFTVTDSNAYAVNRQFFPELQTAFTLNESQALAWAFLPNRDDDSLVRAANRFLKQEERSGALGQLIDRYFGPASRSNFINLTVYQLRIQNRLPRFQTLFEQAAKQYDLDWRLLAAMGYQESQWDPKATSPTGVRGMMMLTEDTAKDLNIADRLNAEQSIDGGTRYLRQMLDRLPAEIQMPDRLWFALAAYNIGLSHLEDARILTQRDRKDPNRWNDVKEHLPLLAQPRWYRQTRYGYARGLEPVRFVNRVRTYYDVLVKIDQEERAKSASDALKLKAPAI